jgi:hypothetical protein
MPADGGGGLPGGCELVDAAVVERPLADTLGEDHQGRAGVVIGQYLLVEAEGLKMTPPKSSRLRPWRMSMSS